ncbi:hypothetical protein [Bacillus cereus]
MQNLEVLEYANPTIQALWNNCYIANVQITASETVGVENRADFYNQAGALRDMVQNHMLQLLMMIAMDLSKHMDPEEIHYGVPPAFRKKTTLRIFSIKKAVILRIKRLFYT